MTTLAFARLDGRRDVLDLRAEQLAEARERAIADRARLQAAIAAFRLPPR